jgi:SAM-dependent methyltransferase
MHDTSLLSGDLFARTYGKENFVVLDIGGKYVNGSLRRSFVQLGMKYICVDIEADRSVDVVVKPGDNLPFEDGSVDLVVSTSCFEHDPCFWITFKEMCRVTKLGGYIYVNAPSNGPYHGHPGDNWRFYIDAGQALAYWASRQYGNETIFPVKVEETFHILPIRDVWKDFVCIWKRVEETTEIITIPEAVKNHVGLLEKELNNKGAVTTKLSA